MNFSAVVNLNVLHKKESIPQWENTGMDLGILNVTFKNVFT